MNVYDSSSTAMLAVWLREMEFVTSGDELKQNTSLVAGATITMAQAPHVAAAAEAFLLKRQMLNVSLASLRSCSTIQSASKDVSLNISVPALFTKQSQSGMAVGLAGLHISLTINTALMLGVSVRVLLNQTNPFSPVSVEFPALGFVVRNGSGPTCLNISLSPVKLEADRSDLVLEALLSVDKSSVINVASLIKSVMSGCDIDAHISGSPLSFFHPSTRTVLQAIANQIGVNISLTDNANLHGIVILRQLMVNFCAVSHNSYALGVVSLTRGYGMQGETSQT
jgi:hypothetical protein